LTSAKSPSVTIVTATFNCEGELAQLFDSLRGQTDRSFDHVVVDGGSTDGTLDIVASNRDIATRTILGPDAGLYDALNKGVRAATTDYYVVAGADDCFTPGAIANFKNAVRSTQADVIVASVLAGKELRRGFRPNLAWRGHASMITSHSVGMLFRRTLHERFGYYSRRFPILADGYFIKLLCNDDAVKIVAADFVAGRFSLDGISNRNLVRVLCESWQIQLETGENPCLQYLLFQLRLLKNLPRLLQRGLRSG
jgi:glycosyltransferase involved in cell wall biosynthesis